MTDFLIRGGRVIDPGPGFDEVADVLVRDGLVVAVGEPVGAVQDVVTLPAVGCVVCPGFIDLHTHLRFPGFPDKETIASGTAAAAAGGFTTVCAMANTEPAVDSPAVLAEVLSAASREAHVRVRQLAAVTHGLRGQKLTDMRALADAGAVAFSDDGKPVWDEDIMREALLGSSALDLPISAHEEDPAIVGGGVANAGRRARRHGLEAWPCEGESSMVRRDIALLEEAGGRLHVAHVSCAETVELIRSAKERGLRLTSEVTPHHLTLTDELLDGDPPTDLEPAHPLTKVNPPLRSRQDVEALIEALTHGTIDAVSTDHAPHSDSDKAKTFATAAFGFSSIETALPLLLGLVRDGCLGMSTLLERLTSGPARVFNVEGGNLAAGRAADICIFDPEKRWVLRPDVLRSKGKNTPLLGRELRGRVMYTLVAGRVVHNGADEPFSRR
ncbi:MAG: dihydroorotase [Chloroflexota bacterium]